MTTQEAIDYCHRYDDHEWCIQLTDSGAVVIGGNDRLKAENIARSRGYHGPIIHWDRWPYRQ